MTLTVKKLGLKPGMRALVGAAMEETGWRPVSQIAIDDVWSALRFRPTQDVKPRK